MGGWTQLPKGDGAAVETALAQHGPVTAVIRANSEAFGFYQGGTILHGCKNREGVSCSVNHGILIVGYNATAWLIRNSWGASWGYDGYAWVSRKYDTKTYNDTDVDQGVWCAPYPERVVVLHRRYVHLDISVVFGSLYLHTQQPHFLLTNICFPR